MTQLDIPFEEVFPLGQVDTHHRHFQHLHSRIPVATPSAAATIHAATLISALRNALV